MSQISKKTTVSKPTEESLPSQRGAQKPKTASAQATNQPKLNFNPHYRGVTPTTVGDQSVIYHGPSSMKDSLLKTHDSYLEGLKPPIAKKDLLNKTQKENEQKSFYRSLKIDLSGYVDKENQHGTDEDLELFNFQEIEQQIQLENRTITHHVTEGENTGNRTPRRELTLKNGKLPSETEKKPEPLSTITTNGNFLPHPKTQTSFKGRSHNAKVVSNIKALDAKKSLSPIGTGPKKTMIDLNPSTAPQKPMTRSNSVLMRRDKSKENNANTAGSTTAAATSGATSSGLTPRGGRNANLKGRTMNNASMYAGDKSPRSQTSSAPLHSLSVYGASSPLSGPHTNSMMVVPQENSSGTNQREGKRGFGRSQRSFSKDYDISPSLIKNDTSMFKEPLLERTETSNIKVIARFRPINNLENELISTGMESECAIFPSEKSIVTVPGSDVWTYDAVFQPSSSQEQIYNFLAKETIDDVLQGYNGTIFAYGQTSSGKTYSMYGDMYDEEKKGVIPRASNHIFNFIRNMDDEVEFVIKCSMLEIYKENLYDLLNDRASNLRIKESPLRGIYIDHLTEISVCSEEEMLGVLEMGHQCRSIATTQLNQYSSRSHTLFIVEITQKFPNQSEKVGKLNLVDLAGSEKVGKSGATGETLEEAKKINLSLSCLGNVIHALTSNAEHIPYRDSKLTRILQESLGGNYKTSLIVTCSPCSSNKEETISTLKFATRAKTIKTHYKVNVHMSSESMMRMIEKLRAELEMAIAEIARLRSGEGPSRMMLASQDFTDMKKGLKAIGADKEEDFDYAKCSEHISTDLGAKSISYQTEGKDNYRMNSLTTPGSSIGMGMNAGFKAILENNLQLNSATIGPRETHVQFYSNEGSRDRRSNKQSATEGSFKLGSELLNQNEVLEARVYALQKSLEAANQAIREKDTIIELKDAEMKDLKDNLVHFEEKLNKVNEENSLQQIRLGHQTNLIEDMKVKIQVLETQAHALTEALISCEQSVEGQLKEKFKIVNQKFTDFTKEILAFKDVNFSEYLDTKIDFNHQLFDTTGWTKESETSLIKSFQAPKTIKENFFGSRLDPKTILTSRDSLKASMDVTGDIDVLLNKYGYLPTSHKSIMKDQISPELMTYLLRQQLIQCHIVNQNLERAIISFEWKQVIDSGKARMCANYMKMQDSLIKSLEHVYEKSIATHEKLREKARLIGNDSIMIHEDSVNYSGASKGPFMSSPRAKILRSVTRESLNRRKTMKKYMESHATSKAQPKDNFAVSFTGSKKTGISMNRLEDISGLIVEIERDILATQNHPNTLDEAKIMLHFQNTIIEKIKNLILKTIGKTTSYTISQRDGHDNKESVEYLQGEYGRLQNKTVVLYDQVKLEKARATQYKEVYLEAKKQVEQFKELIEQIEIAGKNALKLENEMWQSVIEELITNSRKEMQRKQEEVTQLSEQLASWISKYMDLQQKKDVGSFQEAASFVSDGGRRHDRYHLTRDNKGTLEMITHARSDTETTHNPKNTSFTPPLIGKKI